jgi:hypothetical protein
MNFGRCTSGEKLGKTHASIEKTKYFFLFW